MMKPRSWLPTPLMSILLLVVWLLLVRSVAFGHILLGSALAIAIPLFTHRFWDAQPHVAKPWTLLRFVLRVLGDIIIANLEVAWLIANPWSKLRPHFVEYPLMLQDRFTVTLLANTISLTPGTVSANLRMDGKTLLIHALNVDDEEALITHIRERYEQPLKEIYEC
ncbi:Na+/H+ antiporter subunit E [Halomonas urumqiensis]|uniref:Na+/H+ antiporter subunit E n=1 Tax=Halomonas urumqiensis TaxID=1684789 RepID=A0A2N7UC18_9GAMM|nr:Na+/H+ antiporter subunit E [Halomonas urumqiensis]PMR77987.1 Na+/H+ antiporter subunit E [Halomonas urumqiensis]PTB03138.1 Na+/H+ antiporter subunit E [Halomonas urumqiensis]GHE20719.1 monovalent cation/H+ antiporter subunit E [Halomonas urumqiensis]